MTNMKTKMLLTITALLITTTTNASQLFTCYRTNDNAPVHLKINSLTQVEYSTDWDIDGTYEIANGYKMQMWNKFKGIEEDNYHMELEIQGKLFVGKVGYIKEVYYDHRHIDQKVVSTFKCFPGSTYNPFSTDFE